MSVTFGSTNIPLATALTSRALTSRILGTPLSDREYQAVYATYQRTGSLEAARNILADFRTVARAEVAPSVLPTTQVRQLTPTPSVSEVGTYIPPTVPEGTTSRLLSFLQQGTTTTQTRIQTAPAQFINEPAAAPEISAPAVPLPSGAPSSPPPLPPSGALTPSPSFLPPSVTGEAAQPGAAFDINSIIQQITSNPALLIIAGIGTYGLIEFFRRRR